MFIQLYNKLYPAGYAVLVAHDNVLYVMLTRGKLHVLGTASLRHTSSKRENARALYSLCMLLFSALEARDVVSCGKMRAPPWKDSC